MSRVDVDRLSDRGLGGLIGTDDAPDALGRLQHPNPSSVNEHLMPGESLARRVHSVGLVRVLQPLAQPLGRPLPVGDQVDCQGLLLCEQQVLLKGRQSEEHGPHTIGVATAVLWGGLVEIEEWVRVDAGECRPSLHPHRVDLIEISTVLGVDRKPKACDLLHDIPLGCLLICFHSKGIDQDIELVGSEGLVELVPFGRVCHQSRGRTGAVNHVVRLAEPGVDLGIVTALAQGTLDVHSTRDNLSKRTTTDSTLHCGLAKVRGPVSGTRHDGSYFLDEVLPGLWVFLGVEHMLCYEVEDKGGNEPDAWDDGSDCVVAPGGKEQKSPQIRGLRAWEDSGRLAFRHPGPALVDGEIGVSHSRNQRGSLRVEPTPGRKDMVHQA